jgi:hypothetical protein
MFYACRRLPVLLALLTMAGCATAIHQGKSPLLPVQMSPDSVVLDIFLVRFPFGNPDANEKLWEEVDEQPFSPHLRERLSRNGFRVGLVTGQMPMELSKLMELSDKPVSNGKIEETNVKNIDTKPRVVRKHMQLRAGLRSVILASGIYEQLPVLVSDDGRLRGQTYRQAQGLFALKAFPQPDGQVRLELVPELHHDQPRQKWVVDQEGALRLEVERPKDVFDDLAISANLSPGALLILSSLPNRPVSLGHHFFTEKDERQEQKLLVVRLSQTQHDALFDPSQPLKTE